MVHTVKSLARILLFFMLTTSLAWAWDTDSCCTNRVVDTPSATADQERGFTQNKAHDLCGHCDHMGMHFLGQIVAQSDLRSPLSAGLRHSKIAPVKPATAPSTLFRPPRSSSSI